MAREDAGNVTAEAATAEPQRERTPAAGRGPLLRISAFQLMLFGATVIIGAGVATTAAPVPPSRLFFALLAWLVGCLSLFMPRA